MAEEQQHAGLVHFQWQSGPACPRSGQAVGVQEFARNSGGACCGGQGRRSHSARLVARHQNARHQYSRRSDRWHFYQNGKRVFWDVHNPDQTVVIELKDERYNELIVEVADPKAAVELVKAGLPR
jgi:hypothetical protein